MQRVRSLRIVLAVLALLAGQVGTARAALDTTCARAAETRVVVDRADGSRPAATPDAADRFAESRHHTSDDAPMAPPAAPRCATSAASVAPPVIVPAFAPLRTRLAPATTTARRPSSHTPAPPFHPPRAG